MPQALGEGGSTCWGEGGLAAVGTAGAPLCVWNVLLDEVSRTYPGGCVWPLRGGLCRAAHRCLGVYLTVPGLGRPGQAQKRRNWIVPEGSEQGLAKEPEPACICRRVVFTFSRDKCS